MTPARRAKVSWILIALTLSAWTLAVAGAPTPDAAPSGDTEEVTVDYSVASERIFDATDRDIVGGIVATPRGGYLLTGSASTPAGDTDAWAVRLGADGEPEWSLLHGGPGGDLVNDAARLPDGGFVVAGHTNASSGTGDAWIAKLTTAGDIEWEYTYNESDRDAALAVTVTEDGDVVVAGTTGSTDAEGEVLLLKLAPNGTPTWTRSFGGPDNQWANGVVPAGNGSLLVAGYTNASAAGGRGLVARVDAAGAVEWMNPYGVEDGTAEIRDVTRLGVGRFLLGGGVSPRRGEADGWVLELTGDGLVRWQRTYGGNGPDSIRAVHAVGDDTYLAAGQSGPIRGDQDAWFLHLDAEGRAQIEKTYGTDGVDWANDLAAGHGDEIVLVGGQNWSIAGGNGFLRVLDPVRIAPGTTRGSDTPTKPSTPRPAPDATTGNTSAGSLEDDGTPTRVDLAGFGILTAVAGLAGWLELRRRRR